MHLIRRSVFKAASSPSTSFLSKSRSITTSSPFLLRSKSQSIAAPAFRRFASDDVSTKSQLTETDSMSSVSDSAEQSSVASAISSASESVSTYASDAAESFAGKASAARDATVDSASEVASAAGLAFPPRQERRESRFRDNSMRGPRDEMLKPPPSNSVYIGNLLFDITGEDLEREFSGFGNIRNAKVATDSTGLSKGFGYVEFDSVDAATAAIEAKNRTVLEGRTMIVNYQAKTNRPPIKAVPSRTLFVGNLAFEMTDAELNKLFRDIKNVIDVRVAIDRRTGQPRGFAHADFVDEESARVGLEYLQSKEVHGRKLRIDYAAMPTRGRPGRD